VKTPNKYKTNWSAALLLQPLSVGSSGLDGSSGSLGSSGSSIGFSGSATVNVVFEEASEVRVVTPSPTALTVIS